MKSEIPMAYEQTVTGVTVRDYPPNTPRNACHAVTLSPRRHRPRKSRRLHHDPSGSARSCAAWAQALGHHYRAVAEQRALEAIHKAGVR
jgi:hypothetical protein